MMKYLLSASYMPGTVPSAFTNIDSLNPYKHSRWDCYYDPHFAEKLSRLSNLPKFALFEIMGLGFKARQDCLQISCS